MIQNIVFQRSFGMPRSPRQRERTTEAVMGNSTGPVLTILTTLPELGVAILQKKGRSNPSSL